MPSTLTVDAAMPWSVVGKWDQKIHDVCFRLIRRRDSLGSANCKYDIILYCDHVMYVVVSFLITVAARTRVKRKDDSC